MLVCRAICHDPETYPNPEEFNPERFMGPKPLADPTESVFGYGRRLVEFFFHDSLLLLPCSSSLLLLSQIPIETLCTLANART